MRRIHQLMRVSTGDHHRRTLLLILLMWFISMLQQQGGVENIFSQPKILTIALFMLIAIEALLIVILLLERIRWRGAKAESDEALKREKSLAEKAIDSLPAIFFLFDDRGQCLWWNKNFQSVSGYNSEELAGMHLLDFFTSSDRQMVSENLCDVLASGGSAVQADFVSKEGRSTPYYLSGNRVFFDGTKCLLGMGVEITELKKSGQSLRELTVRLLQLREEEHRRIASEMHDNLGQSLAIIKNRAMICLRNPGDPERVKEQLEEISATAASAIDEVREIAHNLRPYELDRLGLVEAIESMISRVSDSTAIRLSADLDRVEGLFTPEAEMGIYRIVQEGLNNVVRHAEASEARVSIKIVGSEVIIIVADNGRGIERHSSFSNGKNGKGFGLAVIAERVRMLGGSHEINSEPGHGTTLTVRLCPRVECD